MSTTLSPARATFRALVADVAARAKEKLPQAVNGRVESAVKLVLMGDVEPQADGTVVVFSATDATRRYVLQGPTCTCADYERGRPRRGGVATGSPLASRSGCRSCCHPRQSPSFLQSLWPPWGKPRPR
jgi:hypothetical protein